MPRRTTHALNDSKLRARKPGHTLTELRDSQQPGLIVTVHPSEILERVVDRGARIAANRLLEVVRRMFHWGIQRDWLDGKPAAQIEKPGVERSRDRVLTNDEIRGEVISMRWADVDLENGGGRSRPSTARTAGRIASRSFPTSLRSSMRSNGMARGEARTSSRDGTARSWPTA